MDYGKLERRYYQQARGVIYYWLLATHQGRRVLLGPYTTEDEANQAGLQQLEGVFEVLSLPTRDRARATQMLKARILRKTANLGESLEKVKHSL